MRFFSFRLFICTGILPVFLSVSATAQLWEATPTDELSDVLEDILVRETSPKITFIIKTYGKSGDVLCEQIQQYSRKGNMLTGIIKGCTMVNGLRKEAYHVHSGTIRKISGDRDSSLADTSGNQVQMSQWSGDQLLFTRKSTLNENKRPVYEEIRSEGRGVHSIMKEILVRKIRYSYSDSVVTRSTEDYSDTGDSLVFLGSTRVTKEYTHDGKTLLLEKRTLDYQSIYESNIPSITYYIQYFYDPQGRISLLTATGVSGYSSVIEVIYK